MPGLSGYPGPPGQKVIFINIVKMRNIVISSIKPTFVGFNSREKYTFFMS